MKTSVVVDTSSFIDYFRYGKDSPVPSLAIYNSIVLSKVVRLELLKGARRQGRGILLTFFDGLIELPEFPSSVKSEQILFEIHGRGLNLGVADLLILTDARTTKSAILSSDRQLCRAATILKIPLL